MDFRKVKDEVIDYIQALADCGFRIRALRRYKKNFHGYATNEIENVVFALDSTEAYILTANIQDYLDEAIDRIEEFYEIDEIKINGNYVEGYPGDAKYSFPKMPIQIQRIEILIKEKEKSKFHKIKKFLNFKN